MAEVAKMFQQLKEKFDTLQEDVNAIKSSRSGRRKHKKSCRHHRRRHQSSSGSSCNSSWSTTCQSRSRTPHSSRGRTPPRGSRSWTPHCSPCHNPQGGTPGDGSDLLSHVPESGASLRRPQSRSLLPSHFCPRSPSFHQCDRSSSHS